MILDNALEFADGADFANEVGTANVGDIIDLGVANRNPGVSRQMFLVVSVDTAADGGAGTAATVAFRLVSDSTTTISTTTATIHFTSKPHVYTDLPAGAIFAYPLPISGLDYERYLGLQLVTAAEGEDALVASAYLTFDPPPSLTSYPDATN